MSWALLTADEVQDLERRVEAALGRLWNPQAPDGAIHIPARLSQSSNITDAHSNDIAILCIAQEDTLRDLFYEGGHCTYLSPIERSSRLSARRSSIRARTPPAWLDLTQFKINPYFVALFADRLSIVNGFYQISLEDIKTIRNGLTNYHIVPKSALKSIESQFVTQPTTKCMRIRKWVPGFLSGRPGGCSMLRGIHKERGIQTGDLVTALEESVARAIANWT